MIVCMVDERAMERAIRLGHPSYVWRAGQERRLAMIREHVPLEGARVLDVGCGLGMYVRRLRQFTEQAHGVDVDPVKVAQASETLPNIVQAPAEDLPYADDRFDVVLLNEVIEHVDSDVGAIAEACRVTRPGGHVVVFAPNRLYPFETHGFYWRGKYRFGNIPLINYLPNALRGQLCPHVRAYTWRGVERLFARLPGRVVVHLGIYAGYDNLVARAPGLGAFVRRISYALERTPLQALGLSHFVVFQKR